MKTFDQGITQEQLIRGLAELAARYILQSKLADESDRSEAGGKTFRAELSRIVEDKTFAKIVKNCYAGYNEEFFLDGFNG